MSGEICVVAEVVRGELTEQTFVSLAAGRKLADALGCRLAAVMLGADVAPLAAALGAADRVLTVEHPLLADFNPEAALLAAESAVRAAGARACIFCHTASGMDLACGVAHRLGAPVVACCRDFTAADGQARYVAVTCGGKIIVEGTLPGPVCVVTVMPGVLRAEQGRSDRTPPVERISPPAGMESVRTKFRGWIDPPAGDVDISRQNILVSVGRGIQKKENIALAERLAAALGGVVTGSRPIIDQGWLPPTRLVGKSGKQVRPRLYLAVGISGAPEHMEGVPAAELMIGINTDARAPIFDAAHYGATCDAVQLMPALAAALGK